MLTNTDALIARLRSSAVDRSIDDAAFRALAKRIAQQLAKLPEATATATQRGRIRVGRTAGRANQVQPAGARYVFVAVPNGRGGTASVSVLKPAFSEMARALGGPAAVTALARKVAAGHKPESGVSRSRYVRIRLEQRAARQARRLS